MKKIIYFLKNHFIRVILGIILIIFSLAATIISTALSCIGLLQLLNKLELTVPNTELFVLSFVIILQAIVFFGSIAKGIVFHQSPQHYNFIIRFIYGAFILSILSTITFFNQFDKTVRLETMQSIFNIIPLIPENLKAWCIITSTDFSLIYLGAILLDIMSMHFPGIGFDLIFKISTKKKLEIEELSYFSKCIKLITYFPKNWIDKKCIEFGIQKSNTNVSENQIQDVSSIKSNTNTNINVSDNGKLNKNNKIQDITNEIQSTTKSIETPDISTSIPCNEDVIIQKNENKIQNKSNTNTDTNILIKKIDEYIILNYKPNEKINVSELKNKFGFKKQDRNWSDKIRPFLKSALINPENKRLTRISIDKKDNLKLIK